MPTVRALSDAVEAKLARDLGAIQRRLADAWAELTDAADGAPTTADVARLTNLARRLLLAYAATNAPIIVAAQQAAVAESVASSRPEGVPAWRPPSPQDVADLAGSVRGGEAVAAWLAGTLLPVADVLASLLDLPDAVAGIASALGGAGARALMGSRTAVHDAGRSATLATYRAQPRGTISGLRWESARDESVCLACAYLDGQIFPLDTEDNEQHVGCRCRLVSVATGEGDINDSGQDWLASRIATGDLRNVPVTARDDVVNGRLELRDFLTRDPDRGFGATYRETSVRDARTRAAREGRSTGPSTLPYPRTGRSADIPPDPARRAP